MRLLVIQPRAPRRKFWQSGTNLVEVMIAMASNSAHNTKRLVTVWQQTNVNMRSVQHQ